MSNTQVVWYAIVGGVLLCIVVLFVAIGFVVVTPVTPEFSYRAPVIQPDIKEPAQDTEIVVSAQPQKTTLLFGGDVMLARHVQVLQEAYGTTTAAWRDVAAITRAADVSVVNLESPFSPTPPYPTEGFVFKTKPEAVDGLRFADIDAVVLANNHFGNAGVEGMQYTFDHLRANRIEYTGAGNSAQQAYAGIILRTPNATVGLVAQTYAALDQATDTTPGVAAYDPVLLTQAITQLRTQGADIIVAQFHGGTEYVREANWQQQEFAHTAIDAGADIVIGHHPHWIQEIEIYKGKYIIYSLGNLIFDQNWSHKTTQGMVVQLSVSNKRLDAVELVPITIEENYKPVVDCSPMHDIFTITMPAEIIVCPDNES